MKLFSINIAKAYTMSDWKGQPAHRFYARLHLADDCNADTAKLEMFRLATVYPFPEYHLELHRTETRTTSDTVLSMAPRAFLDGKLWNATPSIEDTKS